MVEDTAYQCELLMLPETEDQQLRKAAAKLEEFRAPVIFGGAGPWSVPAGTPLPDALRAPEAAGAHSVLFGGALSDFAVKPLLMSSALPKRLCLVVRDSSKLLLTQPVYEKLLRRGLCIEVLEQVNLVALTVNPFSAYGNHFSGDALAERMQARVRIPVINVMEDRA